MHSHILPDRRQLRSFWKLFLRQFRFPPLTRALAEIVMFAALFLAAGVVGTGFGLRSMLAPMVPVVIAMMLCMVASGVYRPEINHSIMRLFVHSAYGLVLSAFAVVITLMAYAPEYATVRFILVFLFFSFFVTNTVRPLISGTDFMDGGGRRIN